MNRPSLPRKSVINRVIVAAVVLGMVAGTTLLGLLFSSETENSIVEPPTRTAPPSELPEPNRININGLPTPSMPSIGPEEAWDETDGPIYSALPERVEPPRTSRSAPRTSTPKTPASPSTTPTPDTPPPVGTPPVEPLPPEPEPPVVVPEPEPTTEPPPPVEELPPLEEEPEEDCAVSEFLEELIIICVPPLEEPITEDENE